MPIPGRIDRSNPTPYYYQLQEILRSWIRSSDLPPDTQIPSEAELGVRFDVSRTVVRQALQSLERDGLIYRVKGVGSFVARLKLRQRISELTSFTEDVRGRGSTPGSRVIRQEMIPAADAIASRLRIAPSTPVLLLKRVRYADDEPLALETAHLAFDGCEALLKVQLDDQSIYQVLETECGIRPCQAEQELEAGVARPREAAWLEIEVGAPVMVVERTTYDAAGESFEYVKSVYRGDKYSFVAQLRDRFAPSDDAL